MHVGSEVPTVMLLKIQIFCYITLCRSVISQAFQRIIVFSHCLTLKMKAVQSFIKFWELLTH